MAPVEEQYSLIVRCLPEPPKPAKQLPPWKPNQTSAHLEDLSSILLPHGLAIANNIDAGAPNYVLDCISKLKPRYSLEHIEFYSQVKSLEENISKFFSQPVVIYCEANDHDALSGALTIATECIFRKVPFAFVLPQEKDILGYLKSEFENYKRHLIRIGESSGYSHFGQEPKIKCVYAMNPKSLNTFFDLFKDREVSLVAIDCPQSNNDALLVMKQAKKAGLKVTSLLQIDHHADRPGNEGNKKRYELFQETIQSGFSYNNPDQLAAALSVLELFPMIHDSTANYASGFKEEHLYPLLQVLFKGFITDAYHEKLPEITNANFKQVAHKLLYEDKGFKSFIASCKYNPSLLKLLFLFSSLGKQNQKNSKKSGVLTSFQGEPNVNSIDFWKRVISFMTDEGSKASLKADATVLASLLREEKSVVHTQKTLMSLIQMSHLVKTFKSIGNNNKLTVDKETRFNLLRWSLFADKCSNMTIEEAKQEVFENIGIELMTLNNAKQIALVRIKQNSKLGRSFGNAYMGNASPFLLKRINTILCQALRNSKKLPIPLEYSNSAQEQVLVISIVELPIEGNYSTLEGCLQKGLIAARGPGADIIGDLFEKNESVKAQAGGKKNNGAGIITLTDKNLEDPQKDFWYWVDYCLQVYSQNSDRATEIKNN